MVELLWLSRFPMPLLDFLVCFPNFDRLAVNNPLEVLRLSLPLVCLHSASTNPAGLRLLDLRLLGLSQKLRTVSLVQSCICHLPAVEPCLVNRHPEL